MTKLFRRFFLLAVLGFAVATPAVAAPAAPATVISRLQAGQPSAVIVEYESQTIESEAARQRNRLRKKADSPAILNYKAAQYALLKQGVDAALARPDIVHLRDYTHLPMSFKRVTTLAGLNALLAAPGIKAVYEDRQAHLVATPPNLQQINQPQVAAAGLTGSGTTVAVIDDGINYTNAAFGSCTAPGTPAGCKVVVSMQFGSGSSDNSHGTNVSAIVLGVAPGSQIAMLNVFSGTQANFSDILSAMNWAISNQSTYNIVAMNMSIGDGSLNTSPCSSGNAFSAPVANAMNAGIMVVAASGNNAYSTGINAPACTPGAISVGAVYDGNFGSVNWGMCTDTTTAVDQIVCFSNSANYLTLLAPGAEISAAGITDSGTSQATPHVTGSIAVLRPAFPADTQAQTLARLVNNGVQIVDPRNGISFPRVNLLAAATPANDLFANRQAITGSSWTINATNVLATKQAGEPNHAQNPGGHSVWWKWTAPTNGQVSLNTQGSSFVTLLAVYTGSIGNFNYVTFSDGEGLPGGTSSVVFDAVAGTEYEIAVDGYNGATGSIVLNGNLAQFANLSVSLSGPTGNLDGTKVTYVVTVANAGPATATNVKATLSLPSSVNANFMNIPTGCSVSGNSLICNEGSLASGNNAVISVQVQWNSGSSGAVVAASVGSNVPDPSPADETVYLQASTDIPTLPQWGAILLAALLMLPMLRATRR